MLGRQVLLRSRRHNLGGVDAGVGYVVVFLDVAEVGGAAEGGNLVELLPGRNMQDRCTYYLLLHARTYFSLP